MIHLFIDDQLGLSRTEKDAVMADAGAACWNGVRRRFTVGVAACGLIPIGAIFGSIAFGSPPTVVMLFGSFGLFGFAVSALFMLVVVPNLRRAVWVELATRGHGVCTDRGYIGADLDRCPECGTPHDHLDK